MRILRLLVELHDSRLSSFHRDAGEPSPCDEKLQFVEVQPFWWEWPNFHRGPFLRGPEDARRYRPTGAHYLANCTMYHMRIRWKHPMPGPLALASGRFCGLGLFAAVS